MNPQELQQFFSQLPEELKQKVMMLPTEEERMMVVAKLYEKYMMQSGGMGAQEQAQPAMMAEEMPMGRYGYQARYGYRAQDGMSSPQKVPVEAERNENITVPQGEPTPQTRGGYLKEKSYNPISGQTTYEIPDNQHNNTHEEVDIHTGETGVNMELPEGSVVNSDKTKIPGDFYIGKSNYKGKTFKDASDRLSALEKKANEKLKILKQAGEADDITETSFAMNFAKYAKLRHELNKYQEAVLDLKNYKESKEETQSLLSRYGKTVSKYQKAQYGLNVAMDNYIQDKPGFKTGKQVLKAAKGLEATLKGVDALMADMQGQDLSIEDLTSRAKIYGLMDEGLGGVSDQMPSRQAPGQPFVFNPNESKIKQFKDAIFSTESSAYKNPYLAISGLRESDVINKTFDELKSRAASTATGKYQFIEAHLPDIRRVTGVKTMEEFRRNPEAQEAFMDWHIQNNLMPTAIKLKQKYNMPFNIYQIMAGLHLEGEGKPYKQGDKKPVGFLGKFMANQLDAATKAANNFTNPSPQKYMSLFANFEDDETAQQPMRYGGSVQIAQDGLKARYRDAENKVLETLSRWDSKMLPYSEKAKKFAEKEYPEYVGGHNDLGDALRHSGTAMYLTAGDNKYLSPFRVIPTNLAGLAHEAQVLYQEMRNPDVGKDEMMQNLKETRSDLYNNFVGSMIGGLPVNTGTKENLLKKVVGEGILDVVGHDTDVKKPRPTSTPVVKKPVYNLNPKSKIPVQVAPGRFEDPNLRYGGDVYMAKGGLIKRKDGSYSQRGLWDNIRANRGSGKKPTAEMLRQERKIRAQEAREGLYINPETATQFGGTVDKNPVVMNQLLFDSLPSDVKFNIAQQMEMGGCVDCGEYPVFAEGGKWIQKAIKHPGRCTPGSPNYDCPKGSPQWNLAQRFKHGDLHRKEYGGYTSTTHIPKFTYQESFRMEDDNNKYFPKKRYMYGDKVIADGGANPAVPSWIDKILDYESKAGSSSGTGLPNFGIQKDKWQPKYPSMWEDNVISPEEAKDFIVQEFLPKVQGYSPEVQARLVDYAFNTGSSPEDLLLYTGGYRTFDDVRTQPYNPDIYTTKQQKLQLMSEEKDFLKKLDEAKSKVYQDIWGRKNNPEVFNITSLPRIKMWDNYDFSESVVGSTRTPGSSSSPIEAAPPLSTSYPSRNYNFTIWPGDKNNQNKPDYTPEQLNRAAAYLTTINGKDYTNNPLQLQRDLAEFYERQTGKKVVSVNPEGTVQQGKDIFDRKFGNDWNPVIKYINEQITAAENDKPSGTSLEPINPVVGSASAEPSRSIVQDPEWGKKHADEIYLPRIASLNNPGSSEESSSSSSSSKKPTFGQRLKYIGNQMLPAIDALALMMERPIPPTLQQKRARYTPTRTDVDINPQLNEMDRTSATLQEDTRGNPALRTAILAQMAANMTQGKNEVLANKYNLENQLYNQEVMRRDDYFNKLDFANMELLKRYEVERLQTEENLRQQRDRARKFLMNMPLRKAEQDKALALATMNTIYDYDPISQTFVRNPERAEQALLLEIQKKKIEQILEEKQKEAEELKALKLTGANTKANEERIQELENQLTQLTKSQNSKPKRYGGTITSPAQKRKDANIQKNLNPGMSYRKYFPTY